MKIKQWLSQYTERVLGCRVNPIELLRRALFTGPGSVLSAAGANQFAGRTALASGTASATISTTIVNSDSIILHAFQVTSTSAASGSAAVDLCVNSIVSGVSFAFANQDGQGRAPGGTIMWEIRRTS